MNNKLSVLDIIESQSVSLLSVNLKETRAALLTGKTLTADSAGRRNLSDALRYAAKQGNGIRFIGDAGENLTLSYRQLEQQAEQAALALLAGQEKAPQAVVLQTRNLRDTVVAAWAGWLAGIPVVPLAAVSLTHSDDVKSHKLAAVLNTLSDVAIICDDNEQQGVQQFAQHAGTAQVVVKSLATLRETASEKVLPEVDPEQPALYLLTSGSTSAPKLVVQSHGNILNRSRASQIVNTFTTEDVSLNWLPLDHVGGIVMFHLQDVVTGCEQIQASTDYVLQDPLRWLDLCSEHDVTLTWAPNFAFELINSKAKYMVNRGWNLSKLRFILNGGESIVARQGHQFIRNLSAFGLPANAMTPSWGMSETCSGVTFSFSFLTCPTDSPFVPVGEPVPGISLRIVDELGAVKKYGQEGHLQISGCSVFTGYLGAASKTSPFSSDGWFNTGDLAQITEQGVSIVGRDKDMIIVNGGNIAFHEIEACINSLPGVDPTNSCVFTQRGEQELLCIALTTSQEEDSLNTLLKLVRASVREKFSVSVDRIWRLTPEQISKTSIGKIQRKKVQQTIADASIKPLWESTPLAENRLVNQIFRRLWQPLAISETSLPVQRILMFCAETCNLADVEKAFAGTDVAVQQLRIQDSSSQFEWTEAIQAQLNSQQPVSHIIYIADSDRELTIAEQATSLLAPLLALLQTWEKARWSLPLTVVTLHGQYVTHTDQPVNPVNSLVTSLVRSAREEIPRLSCRVVDMTDISQMTVEDLLTEIRSSAQDSEIAWRDGLRYVSRLARLKISGNGADSSINPKYVLIGGLGGAGSILAERLAQNADAHIWLIGRTPVENMNAESLMRLARLKKVSTHVHYRVADVADYPNIAEIIAQIQAAEGGNIGRIYQLAGSFRQWQIKEINPAEDFALLDSKVQGSSNLYTIAKEFSVPSLVFCSSANGYLSGAGVALYAVANRYQEALAELAQQEAQLHVTSAGWSMLEDTGLSQGYVHKALTEAKGYIVADPHQAIALLDPVIASGEHACVVGLNPDAPAMAGEFWFKPMADVAADSAESCANQAEETAGDNSADAVAEKIATIWQELLDLDELGWDENLFDLGANSLLLPQVILRIERELGFRPALVDLFQYPDVASLAEFVSDNLLQLPMERLAAVAEAQLMTFWKETLDIDDLSPDENVFDLGANSLLLPQLQRFIETHLQQKVSLVHLFQYPTVATLADFLNGQQS
ncbi:hypothetical protein KP22_16090 [Pectobacterium betavasculorum]|uniref:Carrier domain-containing protein n=1 Tax=Pectobacterium betavasculorum TaxID=55207 RepID=A0A093SZ49_9GAMM|nr:AMP-binding protein [Pectobacterium betavasculorum]KFX03244.1 hypothetical protein KP22_16090 [Pectobacterium betavasculorum]KFX18279.1 hypothetical protein JV35_16690 [Pectobacterium betavasculorum]